jgi:hypothetical protein
VTATEPRLLHFDFEPSHLLVDETTGRVTGIVDWETVKSGDLLRLGPVGRDSRRLCASGTAVRKLLSARESSGRLREAALVQRDPLSSAGNYPGFRSFRVCWRCSLAASRRRREVRWLALAGAACLLTRLDGDVIDEACDHEVLLRDGSCPRGGSRPASWRGISVASRSADHTSSLSRCSKI